MILLSCKKGEADKIMDKITLLALEKEFVVCKITSVNEVNFGGEYVFISKTDDELSLVCEAEYAPPTAVKCEIGFAALKILGPLAFAMVGVLSGITKVLAENGISVFAISTYDTDYILIKRIAFKKALALLGEAGYAIK